MELEQLKTFLCLAKLNSFSRTAEALHVTQPSISTRLNRLEEELGQLLFFRTTKTVELTEAGRVFLEHVERALTIIKNGEESLKSLENHLPSRITLACTFTINYRDLPGILTALHQNWPAISISVRTGRTQFVADSVLDGTAQAGLFRSPFSHPELQMLKLYKEELLLVVPPGHRLTGQKEACLADLDGEDMVAHDSSTRFGELVLKMLQEKGIFPRITMEIDHVETTKELVSKGMGFAILPATTVEKEIKMGSLAGLKVKDLAFQREVLLVYKLKQKSSPEIRIILEVLRNLYPLLRANPTPGSPGKQLEQVGQGA